jgi:hypothetical protein
MTKAAAKAKVATKVAALALALFVLGLSATAVSAQWAPTSATFVFAAPVDKSNCETITAWNDSTDETGTICLNQADSFGGYGSYINIPYQLGFLNGGDLAGCDPIVWGAKNYTTGDGTHAGDTFTVHGSTTCPYYTDEYGASVSHFLDGFSVDVNYLVVRRPPVCYGRRCFRLLTSVVTGGSGEATQVPAS